MSRTGAHAIIIFCLMGAAYYTGKSHGIDESVVVVERVGDYCMDVLKEVDDRLQRIIDNG